MSANKNLTENESRNVNSLRGLACFLVVLNHTVGDGSKGLMIDSKSVIGQIDIFLAYYRLPLFTFISGYLYACRPIQINNVFGYLRGRIPRLYLPLVFVAIPFEFFRELIKSKQEFSFFEIISPLYMANNHFWYLQAMILISLSMVLMELVKVLDSTLLNAMFVLVVLGAYFFVPHNIYIFSISGFFYIFPFFLLGMYSKTLEMYFPSGKKGWILLVLNVLLICMHFYIKINDIEIKTGFGSLMMLVSGCVACLTLKFLNIKNRILGYVGFYSLAIYLLHVYFTNLARILFQYFNFPDLANVLIGVVFGVVGPSIIVVLTKHKPVLSLFFLGKPIGK